MAARPGEENVATLFGDVHYFYGPETEYPPHHRFNKGSYVYLFENAQEGRARVEIANMPGTDNQDAFDGYIDRTNVRYSYKHSCMVSVAIVHDVPNQEEWHLPTYDPTNQNIYHYKLQSLDIYFWTPRDALQFVNAVRRVLPANQVDIQDEPVAVLAAPPPPPPPPPQTQQPVKQQQTEPVSHVVQKLENVALAENATARSGSAGGSIGGVPSFAPPPMAAASGATPPLTNGSSATPPTATTTASSPASSQQQTPGFVPIAYNPAAPAAPETIRPREKTPPPEDDPGQHPLHQRLAQDAATPFSPGLVIPHGLGPLSPGVPPPAFQAHPGAPTFAAPPTYGGPPAGTPGSTTYGQPVQMPATSQPQAQAPVEAQIQQPQPQQPHLSRASTMPIAASSPFGPTFSAPPTQATAAPPTIAPSSTPPAAMAPGVTPGIPGVGGYSQYNYGQTPSVAANTSEYSVHQQLYRPTEGEANAHYKPKQDVRGKFEEGAGRLERGMTGMLKKFEKKFG